MEANIIKVNVPIDVHRCFLCGTIRPGFDIHCIGSFNLEPLSVRAPFRVSITSEIIRKTVAAVPWASVHVCKKGVVAAIQKAMSAKAITICERYQNTHAIDKLQSAYNENVANCHFLISLLVHDKGREKEANCVYEISEEVQPTDQST